MKQAAAQVVLFGRSGAEQFPAMADGFVKTADGASKMSKDTITRLEAAGDAWTKLKNKVTIISGEILAGIFRDLSKSPDAMKPFEDSIKKTFDLLHLDVKRAIDDLKDLNKWLH